MPMSESRLQMPKETVSSRPPLMVRLLTRLGAQVPLRLDSLSLWETIRVGMRFWLNQWLHNLARFSVIPGPLASRVVRPYLHRLRGCKVGKRVFIGDDVYIDSAYPEYVTIEDGAYLTARVTVLCHNRDLTQYYRGAMIEAVPHKVQRVRVGKGAHIGMGTILLPGVTIGEGAIVGAGSVVTKDIPPYTIAVGAPAKVIREISERPA